MRVRQRHRPGGDSRCICCCVNRLESYLLYSPNEAAIRRRFEERWLSNASENYSDSAFDHLTDIDHALNAAFNGPVDQVPSSGFHFYLVVDVIVVLSQRIHFLTHRYREPLNIGQFCCFVLTRAANDSLSFIPSLFYTHRVCKGQKRRTSKSFHIAVRTQLSTYTSRKH